jgi:aspartyl protease family protein
MLAWAFRYLAVAVLVGIGFATLASNGWRLQDSARPAPPQTISRNTSNATRGAAPADDAWQYAVEAGPGGHFVIAAEVNGVPITFLVDTGASEIVLTMADARRLGFDPQHLEFTQSFRTANGDVQGAPVRLRELRVGQFSLYDLDASVNAAPLPVSLLGMSFLDRLHGYQVKNGRLVLEW